MFERILIPLDGAPQAESALDCALVMARKHNSRMTLLSAVSVAGRADEVAERRKEVALYLERTRSKFELPTATEFNVRLGDPATEILSEARESRADLIIIPDRSTGGRSPGDLGRVTSRVLLGSPVPVLLIRNGPIAHELNHEVTVMLDGSRLAEEAIRPAAELARLCGGQMSLATVLTQPPAQFGNTPSRWATSDQDFEQASRYLGKFLKAPSLSGLKVTTSVFTGEIAPFMKTIHEPDNTILVLTTRGESGFSRWVLGGVADHVSRAAASATMVVPPRMA